MGRGQKVCVCVCVRVCVCVCTQNIATDPLQQLHTFYNLSTLLAGNVPGVPRTLRDDQLQVCTHTHTHTHTRA